MSQRKSAEERKSRGKSEEQKETAVKLLSKKAEEKQPEGAVAAVSQDESSICTVCMHSVLDEDPAMQCEICDLWYHIECQSISEAEYGFINEHKSLHWYCDGCNKSVAKVIKMVSSIQHKQDLLDMRVEKIQQETAKMASDIEVTRRSVTAVEAKMKDIDEGKLPDKVVKLIDDKIKRELSRMDVELRDVKEKIISTDTKLDTAIEAKLVEKLTSETIKKELEHNWAGVVRRNLSLTGLK